MKILKIATRNSPLALWQAEDVRQKLIRYYPKISIKLVSMTTEGDRFLDISLARIGGKGLFIKELEQSLMNHEADIAVHSMKDVTIDLPEGMALPVIMQRESTNDALVSNKFNSISDIPEGGIVGTSSLRRQSQIKSLRPDIVIKDLRGNIGTRLRKLDEDEYDAIILAAAGIKRLGLNERIAQSIPHSEILPAIGQGAVGIECRQEDHEIMETIAPLNDQNTARCVEAERAFSRKLFGGCQLPIAGQATICDEEISLTGMVARVDGSEVIKNQIAGNVNDIEGIGIRLAEILLKRGADKILEELIDNQRAQVS